MAYRVELSERAVRDLRRLYRTINAEDSQLAHAWFNRLERLILSLDANPARGAAIRENPRLRHLLYGRSRNVYRIIYAIDERKRVVTVLHVRHGTRDAFRPDEEA